MGGRGRDRKTEKGRDRESKIDGDDSADIIYQFYKVSPKEAEVEIVGH